MEKVRWFLAVFAIVLMVSVPAYADPPKPAEPVPFEGEEHVTRTVTLMWDCTDPDGGTLTFEIWMRRLPGNWPGEPNEYDDLFKVRMAEPLEDTDYTLECLKPGTTYVWRVRAIDFDDGSKTWGPTWYFTTGSFAEITSVLPNPVQEGRLITIRGYGFLDGTPVMIKIGKRKFRFDEIGENEIHWWKDCEIRLELPRYNKWPEETRSKTVRLKQRDEYGEKVTIPYDTKLVIYQP